MSNKIEDLNLKIFSKIKRINESKPLIQHISCECRREFSGRKFNLK